MAPNPTLRWERLKDKFYRTIDGYFLQWDVDLAYSQVAICPYGGAIAVTRDRSRVSIGTVGSQDGIDIYSGSGRLLHSIPWSAKSNGPIKFIGWTDAEVLVVASSLGILRCYYDFDGNFRQVSLGKVVEEESIHSCRITADGIICLIERTRSSPDEPPLATFIVVTDIANPSLCSQYTISAQLGPVLAWEVASRNDLNVAYPLLVSTEQGVVYQVGLDGPPQTLLQVSADFMAVSPNGEQVAVYDSAQSKLSICYLEPFTVNVELKAAIPNDLVWCGNDAVALVYDSEFTVVTDSGAKSTIFPGDDDDDAPSGSVSSTIACFAEVDGLRVLTNTKHDLFSKVPEQVVDIFRLGSTAPGAILRDCIDQIDRNSPQADENLRVIVGSLRSAVDACVYAARLEFEPYWQKRLMRAALFGKSAIPSSQPPYNSDGYVETIESLRVLNQVRSLDVGLLVSYPQYQCLGPLGLISRLLSRKMHHFAFEVCQFLKLPEQPVYVDWACAKIKKASSPDPSAELAILKRLEGISGIAYDQIAKIAFEEGQQDLALRMVQRDARPDCQIPLLLTMNQSDSALNAAVASRDPSLVYYVLRVLVKRLPLATFLRLVNVRPLASACFEQLCKANDEQLLVDFYYQADKRLDTAVHTFGRAVNMSRSSASSYTLDEVKTTLEESQKLFENAGGTKSFDVRAVDEYNRLLSLQQLLEHDYEQPFVGLSIVQTISQLIKIGQSQRASKVKDAFKISDKQFWWTKLDAIVYRRDWDMLRKFANSAKSPIGYKPFFSRCLAAGAQREAVEYISLCYELNTMEKVDLYLKVNEQRTAMQYAFKQKNRDALHHIRNHSTPVIQQEIDTLLSQMK